MFTTLNVDQTLYCTYNIMYRAVSSADRPPVLVDIDLDKIGKISEISGGHGIVCTSKLVALLKLMVSGPHAHPYATASVA